MKSIFVWNVPNVSKDVDEFVDIMLFLGVTDVFIKAANGNKVFIPNTQAFPGWGENLKTELVDALHKKGINVHGWQFLYGDDYKGEGRIAGEQVVRLGLDGWIFDQESYADAKVNANSNAVHTCLEYKKITDKPIYLCWWARYKNPSTGSQWHPDLMTAKEYIQSSWDKYVSGYIPMAYWFFDPIKDSLGVSAAKNLVEECYSQYREITDKPIIMAGRAYHGDGDGKNDRCTTEAMVSFANKSIELGCGLSWWSAEHAIKIDGVLSTISGIYEESVPQSDTTENNDADENEKISMIVNTSTLNIRDDNNKIIGGLIYGSEIEVLGDSGTLIQNGRTYEMVDFRARCAKPLLKEKK